MKEVWNEYERKEKAKLHTNITNTIGRSNATIVRNKTKRSEIGKVVLLRYSFNV